MRPDPYFFGQLRSVALPSQAAQVRDIILTDGAYPGDDAIAAALREYLSGQDALIVETVTLINSALLPIYGGEYLGLFDDDWAAKADLLKWLNDRFPGHSAIAFKLADCMLMSGKPPADWYPVLRIGMPGTASRTDYPSVEIFEALVGTAYNFEFEILLLEHYYQPCTEAEFEDYREDYLKEYTDEEQRKTIRELRWKGL